MRITKAMLQARVDRLNKVLNRPAEGWTRIKNAEKGQPNMRANVGHFILDTSSPGDGWTRYTLASIVSVGGGEHCESACLNAQEMWAYLRGVFDVLDTEYTHNFDKHASPVLDVSLSNE